MIDYINIANYADDNASFVTGDTPLNVIMRPKKLLNGLPTIT